MTSKREPEAMSRRLFTGVARTAVRRLLSPSSESSEEESSVSRPSMDAAITLECLVRYVFVTTGHYRPRNSRWSSLEFLLIAHVLRM